MAGVYWLQATDAFSGKKLAVRMDQITYIKEETRMVSRLNEHTAPFAFSEEEVTGTFIQIGGEYIFVTESFNEIYRAFFPENLETK